MMEGPTGGSVLVWSLQIHSDKLDKMLEEIEKSNKSVKIKQQISF